jgi:hypothetical protein
MHFVVSALHKKMKQKANQDKEENLTIVHFVN